MKDSKVGEAVTEEERVDNSHNDRKPGASGLAAHESFRKVENATNPEKLARDKYREETEEKDPLVRVDEYQGRTSECQQESNDALVSSEGTDDFRHLGDRKTSYCDL